MQFCKQAVLETVACGLSVGIQVGLMTKPPMITGEPWEGGCCFTWDLNWDGGGGFEFDLWNPIQLPADIRSNKKFNDKLRPGCHTSDTLEIQYSLNGGREAICLDLLPFTNRCFCRGRQYKNSSRQVRTAVHLAYLAQCILWIKSLAGMSILEVAVRTSMTLVGVSTSQVHRHPVSHAGNPALDFKWGGDGYERICSSCRVPHRRTADPLRGEGGSRHSQRRAG